MTDKELDDLFQNTFTGHEMPVPPGMWERVNPQKDKRRRGAFLWWSVLGAAALLILAGTAAWLYHTPPKTTLVSSAAVPVNGAGAPDKIKTAPSGQTALPAQKAGMADSASDVSSLFDKDTDRDNKAGNKVMNSYFMQSHSGSASVISRGKQNLPGNNRAANGSGNTHSNAYSSKTVEGSHPATDVPGSGSVSPEIPIDERISSSSPANAQAQKPDSSANAGNTLAKQEAKAPAVKIKKIHGEKALGFELMVAGYGNDRNVYAAKNGNTIAPFAEVNRQEKVLMHSVSINARIEKPLTAHLSFKTGLQYLRTRQRVSYGYESVNQTPSISSFGNDTLISARLQTKQSTLIGYYNNFSVPVLLSYHTNGSNISFGATAGVMVNVLSWYHGEVPDAGSYQSVAAKDVFRHRTGASLYAGITASKQVGGFRLFAEPHIQYTLSSITKSSAGFRQKMTSYGVGIGIRKTIGK